MDVASRSHGKRVFVLMAWLISAVPFAGPSQGDTLAVDDFSSDTLAMWQSSTSPEYYRGGHGRQGLTIEQTQSGRALRAAFGFGDPRSSEPIWITRRLDPPVPRLPIRAVRFRYRWEVFSPADAEQAPVDRGGFKVRLRTSPRSFTDFDVPTIEDGYPVGRWIETEVDTYALNSRVRNVYSLILQSGGDLGRVQQLTFRLDDIDQINARGALWLADIRFLMDREHEQPSYTPKATTRPTDDRLDILNICHNGDGFYDFGQAARLVDGRAHVVSSSFRGLHFPIWQFPPTRDELLRFDVIVLGDVDPWVFSTDQLHWIADAVYSGTGLLVCSGPQSFSQARRHPSVLLDMLPVTYQRGASLPVANTVPAKSADHPLVADLDPAWLGTVRRVGALQARDQTGVVLTAGGHPLLIQGHAGKGRVLALNTWAQPTRPEDGSFMTTSTWSSFAARLLAWLARRELPAAPPRPVAPPGRRLEARWLYGKSAFAPGSPFGLIVVIHRGNDSGAVTVRATLRSRGRDIWSRAKTVAPDDAEARFDGALPDLMSGPLEMTVGTAGAPPVRLRGHVVDPLRREDLFPLITYLPTQDGGHSFDFDRVDGMVREVYDHGFNTIAVGGLGSCAGGGMSAALRGRAEATAARLGMASILEYTNFTAYRRGRRYEVSPFASEFDQRLRERLANGIEQARYVPRLLSVKFVDEPFVTPANIADDGSARQAFHTITGMPYTDREKLQAEPATRYAYARFLSAYLERDFAAGRELKLRSGAPWDLLLTFCSPGYGACRPLDSFEDVYRWTRQADRIDFDVYPYFYPVSDRIRFVQANWCFAATRVIARRFNKPWGFYVELDDRNYPYQINPTEASAECAYTATAAGAEYLNTFILRSFGTGNGARPERWEKCGQAMRTLRRIGSLLNRWKRQPARVAVLLPEAHQIVHNGYVPPMHALSLLAQACGDADVIHEQLFANAPPPALQVLVLCGVSVLHHSAHQRLLEWTRAGGLCLFDRLPEADETGRPLDWPPVFSQATEQAVFGGGRVVRWSGDLRADCRQAVEGRDQSQWPILTGRLEQLIRRHLRPTPEVVDVRVTANVRQTDVGVRHDGGSACAIIVNHAPEPRQTTVELRHLPFPPRWLVDLTTGEQVGLDFKDNVLTLASMIPARAAWLVGVYDSQPDELHLDVSPQPIQRGRPMRLRVRLRSGGASASGTHLVDLQVIDPEGADHPRFGGAAFVSEGERVIEAPVPLDAPAGRWSVRARMPYAAATGGCAFRIPVGASAARNGRDHQRRLTRDGSARCP